MLSNPYPSFELSLGEFFLVNPILHYYTFLEKAESKVIYSRFFGKPKVVVQRLRSYPIYLSELGRVIALDITSQNLDKRFINETGDFEGIYSENKVLISKLKRYDKVTNRAVSWGQIFPHKIPKRIYRVYQNNLLNDLLSTPSLMIGKGLYAPTRWFCVGAKTPGGLRFRANVNYNMGLIFLKPEDVENSRRVKIWANQEMILYEVNAGFLDTHKDGRVKYSPLKVHFPENPIDLKDKIRKGDYFLCFLISFNEYKTNYSKCPYSRKFNINIIEDLLSFTYSKYDILRFTFPNYGSQINPSSYVFEWRVPKKVVERILSHMSKFGDLRDYELIESFEKIFEKQNMLIKIKADATDYIVRMLNPVLIHHFLRKSLTTKNQRCEDISKDLILSKNPLEKMKRIYKNKDTNGTEYLLHRDAFGGIGRTLKARARQMDYIQKNFYRF